MNKFFLFAFILISANVSAQELKPTMTQALLKVSVVDDKNKPQANQRVTFTSVKDGKEFSGTTDAPRTAIA